MVFRSLRLATSLAVIPAALAACRQESAIPVAVQTVRLALVAGAQHGGAPLSTPHGCDEKDPRWYGTVHQPAVSFSSRFRQGSGVVVTK